MCVAWRSQYSNWQLLSNTLVHVSVIVTKYRDNFGRSAQLQWPNKQDEGNDVINIITLVLLHLDTEHSWPSLTYCIGLKVYRFLISYPVITCGILTQAWWVPVVVNTCTSSLGLTIWAHKVRKYGISHDFVCICWWSQCITLLVKSMQHTLVLSCPVTKLPHVIIPIPIEEQS